MEHSAYPILAHLLQQRKDGDQSTSVAVVRTILKALWAEYEAVWLPPLSPTVAISTTDDDANSNAKGAPSPQIDVRLKHGLESSLMVMLVSLKYGVGAEFEARVVTAATAYFSQLERFISDADGDVYGYLWDDLLCAVLLKIVGCLARFFELRGGLGDVKDDIRAGSRSEAMEVLVAWMASVLTRNASNAEVSSVYQKLVLLFSIAVGADRSILRGSAHQADSFRQLFLQCANVLADRQLQAVLFSSILHNGGITGTSLYATDFDVLLCIIRRSLRSVVIGDELIVNVLQTVEKLLLRDVAPPRDATSTDVGEWIQRLDLSGGNYKAVLKAQGVDGEVLWSDLTSEDFMEMGIHNEEDARRISDILLISRQ